MPRKFISLIVFLIFHSFVHATIYYVAPGGSDSNAGTITSPLETIQKAQQLLQPGDTVYIRGGTYRMQETKIARKENIWAYVTYLDKSGSEGKPIHYFAYPGEKPVFDLSYQTGRFAYYSILCYRVLDSL